ncbi:hypothetical protein TNIN_55411 [Trichonephila inaurata madagascariensis]|uniref:Uncharacterized protein n=1 Tax=Trichonephila inaurata madagascariensis TaxID=2747483 RepID=A0A8X6YZP1_9ARAC|nr:hypothetical protein TNIN_55411 [Trichonephila inaurata madagascariensis]
MEKTKFTGTGFKKLVGEVRVKTVEKRKTRFCIIDAQSVKKTDTAEEKGYDTVPFHQPPLPSGFSLLLTSSLFPQLLGVWSQSVMVRT